MKTEKPIDSVTLTIINNYLVNTCREMGLAMMKTSYSSIFNEGLDFSCVIFDRDGEMVAYAEFVPPRSAQSSTPCSGQSPKSVWRTSSPAMW